MSFWEDARQALVARANTVVGFPPIQAIDDDIFDPPGANTPWARMHMIPVSERPFSLAASTIDHRGLFQIDLMFPLGSGTAVPEALADAVKQAFPPGRTIPAGSDRMIVRWAERSRNERQDHWMPFTVTIGWWRQNRLS